MDWSKYTNECTTWALPMPQLYCQLHWWPRFMSVFSLATFCCITVPWETQKHWTESLCLNSLICIENKKAHQNFDMTFEITRIMNYQGFELSQVDCINLTWAQMTKVDSVRSELGATMEGLEECYTLVSTPHTRGHKEKWTCKQTNKMADAYHSKHCKQISVS